MEHISKTGEKFKENKNKKEIWKMERKSDEPCTLQGFYNLVYYEQVSQEYRHRSELKKKAGTFWVSKKIAGRDSQQEKKKKIRWQEEL